MKELLLMTRLSSVIIKAVFSSVKPIPAAAHPEYEFNIEITTGMSAPQLLLTGHRPKMILL